MFVLIYNKINIYCWASPVSSWSVSSQVLSLFVTGSCNISLSFPLWLFLRVAAGHLLAPKCPSWCVLVSSDERMTARCSASYGLLRASSILSTAEWRILSHLHLKHVPLYLTKHILNNLSFLLPNPPHPILLSLTTRPGLFLSFCNSSLALKHINSVYVQSLIKQDCNLESFYSPFLFSA